MRVVLRMLEKQASDNVFKAVRKMILASGLPFEPARMNAHWPRFSYGPSVAVSQIALREYVDIYLRTFVSAEEVKSKLEAVCPDGLTILNVQRVPYALPSVQNLAAAATFSVEGNFEAFALKQTIEDYFNASRAEVVYQGKNGFAITKNIKPYLLEAKTISPEKIQLTLACVADKWIQPQEVLAGYLGISVPLDEAAWSVEGFTFIREGLYWRDSQGELHLI